MKLVLLYFDGVFCGWAEEEHSLFFEFQGYTIARIYEWPIL